MRSPGFRAALMFVVLGAPGAAAAAVELAATPDGSLDIKDGGRVLAHVPVKTPALRRGTPRGPPAAPPPRPGF